MTGCGWTYLKYEAGVRINSNIGSILFLDIFHILTVLVIGALFKAIIWEIFSVLNEQKDI